MTKGQLIKGVCCFLMLLVLFGYHGLSTAADDVEDLFGADAELVCFDGVRYIIRDRYTRSWAIPKIDKRTGKPELCGPQEVTAKTRVEFDQFLNQLDDKVQRWRKEINQ